MSATFYTILTNAGKAALANAWALGTKVDFKEMALGSGSGEPAENQESLQVEKYRAQINSVDVGDDNPDWIKITMVVPASEGGFTVREAGVFDTNGTLLAVGKYPDTYKPVLAEGSTKDLIVEMVLEVSNAEAVELKIDPTVVLASKQDLLNHTELGVSESEVHGIRVAEGDFEYFDGVEWRKVKGGSTIQVGNVKNFGAAPGNQTITLNWSDPDDVVLNDAVLAAWGGTKIVRKTGSFPISENDGTVVVDNAVRDQYKTTGFVDEGLTNDTTYYYMAFPYTTEGAVTVDEVNRVSETAGYKLYGFKRERGNSNPATRITYLEDAVGMTPAFTDLSTNIFNPGDWQNFIEDVNRPVMLKTDGEVDYELDRDDTTKKLDGSASDIANSAYDGNAMLEWRKYRWVKRYADATYDYCLFCTVQLDENFKADFHTNKDGHTVPLKYTSIFEGADVGGKMRSIAGLAVKVNTTRQQEVDLCTANGDYYYTPDKSEVDYIADLITLITKSDHSQDTLGAGRTKSSNTTAIATGTLKDKGAFWGSNDGTSGVKCFGIENFWGNTWTGIAGLINDNGNIKVKMVPPYNFDGAEYHATGVTPGGTNGGYVNIAEPYSEYGYIPKTASGDSVTYYCDGLWFNNAQVNYALFGGYWSSAGLAGCRFVYLYYLASSTNATVGSRLSFTPPA